MADRRPRYNSMISSAARLTPETARNLRQSNRPWQTDGWKFYDGSGELRNGVNWQSNAASRVRLLAAQPAERPGDEPTPIEDGLAFDLVQSLAGGVGGQSGMLSDFTTNLAVPGECWLVGESPEDQTEDGATEWRVRSNDEVKVGKSGQVRIQRDESRWVPLGDESLLVRVWRPHKRYGWLADSPVRAALPILQEIELLNRHILSTAQSRLAGAGIVFIPQEITFPTRKDRKLADGIDPFMAELTESMLAPIGDPGNPSAVVPIVVRTPGEFIEKVKHLRFDTPFDERVLELRDAAIRRLATALDLPAEVLLGVGDVNHWTAWQIEESALTLHLDPMIEVIAHALTVGYLRPALEAAGENTDAIIWYDTTELQVRPDRSETAMALLDRFIINPEAAIREAGLEEADTPTDQQVLRMAALMALRSPETWEQGIRLLGKEPPPGPATVAPAQPPGPAEPPEPRSLPEQDQPDAVAAAGFASFDALVEACDGLTTRAFEKAGNRLRSWSNRDRQNGALNLADCPAAQTHCRISPFAFERIDRLFEGAWERVPEVAQRYGVNAACLEDTLSGYAWRRLAQQKPHDRELLALELQVGCCWEPERVA